MREIKFRGKHLDKWLYGSLHMNESGQPAIATPSAFHFRCVDPDTVGQYTGLKDSEGREIYEGDIVQLDGWDKPTVVIWDDRSGMYIVDRDLIFSHVHKFSKVIGNVHENPSLLESKHDQ